MTVRIHPDRCISAGLCASRLPHIFTQTATEGVVVLLDADPDEEDLVEVREAAQVCPSQAIELLHDPA